MKIEELKIPCYVVDEGQLEENLKLLKQVSQETGCRILLAQKEFACFHEYPLIGNYLDGTTSSGPYEATLVGKDGMESAKSMLSDRIRLLELESDDAWARDVGPTFVIDEQGDVRGIDWQFNAWGEIYDGLYADWHLDNLVASRFCGANGYPVYPAQHLVMEGGSIHSYGKAR